MTQKGMIAGAIVWIILIVFGLASSSCAKSSSCDGMSLFYFAIFSVGALVPACFVGLILFGSPTDEQ